MKRKNILRQLWKDLLLIFSERKESFCEYLSDWWNLRVTRARVWKAWKDFEGNQKQMSGNVILDAGLELRYENYLSLLETNRLHKLARKYYVPLPKMEEGEIYERLDWDIDPNEPYYFTEKGFSETLPKVEEAMKKRREKYSYWFGMLMALIAAMTGLISVLS